MSAQVRLVVTPLVTAVPVSPNIARSSNTPSLAGLVVPLPSKFSAERRTNGAICVHVVRGAPRTVAPCVTAVSASPSMARRIITPSVVGEMTPLPSTSSTQLGAPPITACQNPAYSSAEALACRPVKLVSQPRRGAGSSEKPCRRRHC